MTADPLRGVVFDLDGTLADSAADIHHALVTALAAEGLPAVDVASVRLMIGGGPRLLVTRALDRLGVSPDDALVDRLTQGFHDTYLAETNRLGGLFDAVPETLRELRAAGLRVGLCSNKPDDLCRRLLAYYGIDTYFDVILGSGAELPKKPDPAPLLRVVELLGIDRSAALYVGDSETDVRTARAAGVQVALVSYGYKATPAAQLGADRVVDSIGELFTPQMLARSA